MRLTIGQSMRRCRKAKGYSMEKVSRQSGIPESSLWNYENDKHYPRILVAAVLADVYGVTIDELIGRDQED